MNVVEVSSAALISAGDFAHSFSAVSSYLTPIEHFVMALLGPCDE